MASTQQILGIAAVAVICAATVAGALFATKDPTMRAVLAGGAALVGAGVAGAVGAMGSSYSDALVDMWLDRHPDGIEAAPHETPESLKEVPKKDDLSGMAVGAARSANWRDLWSAMVDGKAASGLSRSSSRPLLMVDVAGIIRGLPRKAADEDKKPQSIKWGAA
jgi:hypothetical protein